MDQDVEVLEQEQQATSVPDQIRQPVPDEERQLPATRDDSPPRQARATVLPKKSRDEDTWTQDKGQFLSSSFRTSDEMDQLLTGLVAANLEFGPIEKNQRANITARREGARSYSYDYFDLFALMEAIRVPLAKNGIVVIQPPELMRGGVVSVVTIVAHKSGQWMSNKLSMRMELSADPKELGIAISYLRRYNLAPMLALAAGVPDNEEMLPQGRGEPSGGGAASRPQAGRRRSEQPAPVGKVKRAGSSEDKAGVAYRVELNTGFRAATRDKAVGEALVKYADTDTVVELSTQDAKTRGALPNIIEFSVVREGAA